MSRAPAPFNREPPKKTGIESALFTDPLNSLGISHQLSQSDLKVSALITPVQYIQARNVHFEAVVAHQIKYAYESIWNICSSGAYNGGQLSVLVDGDLKKYAPNMPDSAIERLAHTYATKVLTMWTDIFQEVLPERFESMADAKLKHTAVPAS